MASTMKVILVIALTMALSLAITMRTLVEETEEKPPLEGEDPLKMPDASAKIALPSKRSSRFLADTRNPRAADHCNKDGEVCTALGENYTCCNNKCVDLSYDKNNCGGCKNKCKFTYGCCGGRCTSLAYDKRNCGRCGNRCPTGDLCFYGLCNYNG
ncbi:stigma-specific STIG1-like protein 2 [Rhodamnia argentea]|uniref:Stigma-specific STIG1-like protein 2 n=1 Tax=Rhodamnia argentea TaxID=178133 RepID=A0A8B8Q9D7_9MYRT|nr:stigma-specific STIG1-like protein 2 [Rhodamnia argentea]